MRGFTLIELLVVIAVIGILASLALASFTTVQRQARDIQRKSDIRQYSTALEAFANKSDGLYPSYKTTQTLATSDNVLCTILTLTNCPVDPVDDPTSVNNYKFVSNGGDTGGSPKATSYVLWSLLENAPNYFVVCSSGKVGIKSSTGWADPAPDPVTDALNCPI